MWQLGGSTKRLAQTYAPEKITGINISEVQIADARGLATGCIFRVMDATKLDFTDNHFDAVVCVEAACHFDSRDKFLKEAAEDETSGPRFMVISCGSQQSLVVHATAGSG